MHKTFVVSPDSGNMNLNETCLDDVKNRMIICVNRGIVESFGEACMYRDGRRIVARTNKGSANKESERTMNTEAQPHRFCVGSSRTQKKKASNVLGKSRQVNTVWYTAHEGWFGTEAWW